MKLYKTYVALLLDVILVVFAFSLSVLILDNFKISIQNYRDLFLELPYIIVFYILVFNIFGMYKTLWKYASISELLRGGISNFFAMMVSYLFLRFTHLNHFSFSLFTIAFFTVSTGTVGWRLSYRLHKFYYGNKKNVGCKDNTIIIGAGNAGIMLIDEILNNHKFEKNVIGFLDDNKNLVGKKIRGIEVLGTTDDILKIADKYDVSTIIIAVPSLSLKETSNLLNKITISKCKIYLFPPFYEMLQTSSNGKVKLRDINIEDLLGREPIVLEEDGIKEYIDSKTIIVTGGGGSIGSELCRQLRTFNPAKIIIIDIYENNAYDLQMELERLYRSNKVKFKPEIIVLIASVRDEQRIDEIFNEYRPDVVFHAAAHKHVPLMEVSPKEAIKNNVFGTFYVAKAASKYHASKFVLISTDKAVNPTNVMGATKRFAERIVMAFNEKSETEYSAVRFGNVLGSNGSVIPLFKKQIEDGGPVTVTHPEIIRYFMTIPEACQLVIQAGAYAKGGELFVLDMGNQVKILELAEKMIRLSGFDPYKDINIEFSGLRPGEKMFEELLVNYDRANKTNNERIFVESNPSDLNYDLETEIQNIKDALDRSNNGEAIKLLKGYISTYKKV